MTSKNFARTALYVSCRQPLYSASSWGTKLNVSELLVSRFLDAIYDVYCRSLCHQMGHSAERVNGRSYDPIRKGLEQKTRVLAMPAVPKDEPKTF